jgi:hypothetical protein
MNKTWVRFGSNLDSFLVFFYICLKTKPNSMVTNMKKIYMLLLCIAACAAMVPTLVLAEGIIEENNADGSYDESLLYDTSSEKDEIEEYLNENTDVAAASSDAPDQRYLKLRGKWGFGKDKEFDGYFGGRITLRSTESGHRVGVFRGLYNKTGCDEKYSIVGIMKKGYFNGKVTTAEGVCKCTALYTIDKENHLLKMQWMIPHQAGWAIARIQIEEN